MTAEAAGIHRSVWSALASNGNHSFNSVITNATRTAALQSVADGAVAFYLDFVMPSTALRPRVAMLPFAAAGIAVVFNVPTDSGMELTVDELGRVLRGDGAEFDVRMFASTVRSSALRPVLVRDGGIEQLLADVVRATPLAAPSIGSDFAARVRANPRVIWAETAEDALRVASATPYTLALDTYAAAVRSRMRVAAIAVPHPRYPTQNFVVPTFPKFGVAGEVLEISSAGVAVIRSDLEPVYPLVMPAVMSVSAHYACNVSAREWTEQLIALTVAPLTDWHLKPLPSFTFSQLVSAAMGALCHQVAFVPSRGSSAMQDIAAELGLHYFRTRVGVDAAAGVAPLFVGYGGGGSGAGITAIKAGTHLFTGSDSLFSDAEYAAFPDVQFVPFTSFAVTLPINVPGIRTLVLPRCTVVGIFTGRVQYWDDAQIVRFNPTELLPHERISVVVRVDRSGTTEVFTTGLLLMDQVCNGNASTVRVVSTWATNFSGQIRSLSSSGVIQAVAATPYSIGYSSVGTVRVRGLSEATLVDEQSLIMTTATEEFLKAAVSAATLDDRRMVLRFQSSAEGYPFAGVAYVLYNASMRHSCAAMRRALEWIMWGVLSGDAARLSLALDFVPLPANVAEQVRKTLLRARCNGELLLPQDPLPPAKEDNKTTTAIVASLVTVAVLGLAVFAWSLRGGKQRDTKYAPKDASKPYTLVFTDIQGSTSLWARVPEEMGPALDQHHEIIRGLIKKHRGYEVKTVGDAFFIAFESADDAVNLCEELQWAFFQHDWGTAAIDETYRQLEQEALEDDPATLKTNSCKLPRELYEKMWNGLRVRCGIHTGLGDIKFDPVTLGYDYYGSTSNIAARVESVCNGGQVCMTAATAAALKTERALTSLGPIALRGCTEPVEMLQLDPIPGRSFPPLRLDAADEADELTGSDAATQRTEDTNPTASDLMSTRTENLDTSSSTATSMTQRHARNENCNLRDAMPALFSTMDADARRSTLRKLGTKWRVTVKHSKDVKGECDDLVTAIAKRVLGVLNAGRRRGPATTVHVLPLGSLLLENSQALDESHRANHHFSPDQPSLPDVPGMVVMSLSGRGATTPTASRKYEQR